MSSPLVVTDPAAAAAALRSGGLAAIPTETVYGLAADATQPDAVDRIFEVKGRPRGHPLILHVADPDLATWHDRGWVALDDPMARSARRLAEALWPGPLTMIVPRGEMVSDAITGGRDTVALRVPAHPAAQTALTMLDRPVAAPSANRFGRVSPTAADHVVSDIGTLLTPGRDVILDGGASVIGLESTIVELADGVQILRPGSVTRHQVETVLGHPVTETAGPARASGMLEAHYAPRSRVVVVDTAVDGDETAHLERCAGNTVTVHDLSADPDAAARDIYALLRAADDRSVDVVVIVQPRAEGIGIAVQDRLRRAAAGSATPSTG